MKSLCLPRIHFIAAIAAMLFLAISTTPSQAGELSTAESKAVLERAEKVKVAFDNNDTDTIVKYTHPCIFKLTNGKEGFEKLTKTALEMLKTMEVKILESSSGKPTETYQAGEATITFVPRTTVMQVKDQKIRSEGFLIAIKGGADAPDWLFLDGAGLRNNPGLLKTLLPDAPEGIKFPANTVEPIKAE